MAAALPARPASAIAIYAPAPAARPRSATTPTTAARAAPACTNEHGTTTCATGKCTPLCATRLPGLRRKPGQRLRNRDRSVALELRRLRRQLRAFARGREVRSRVCKVTTCDAGFDNCDGDAKNGCEADLTLPATCGSCANKCSGERRQGQLRGGQVQHRLQRGPRRLQERPQRRLRDGSERQRHELQRLRQGVSGGRRHARLQRRQVRHLELHRAVGGLQRRRASTGRQRLRDQPGQRRRELRRLRQRLLLPERLGQMPEPRLLARQVPSGLGDCTASAGCETALGTTANCRSCGQACSNAHGSTSCGAAGCLPVCALGYEDCDGKPENGCETSLTTLGNCGACGAQCSKSHGSASCTTGSCEIASCTDGWDDCDDEATSKNGCETDLHTLKSCGACGKACSYPNASGRRARRARARRGHAALATSTVRPAAAAKRRSAPIRTARRAAMRAATRTAPTAATAPPPSTAWPPATLASRAVTATRTTAARQTSRPPPTAAIAA